MPRLDQRQLAIVRRTERVIGLIAPALDLLLAAGERVSRMAERDRLDDDHTRPLSADASRRVTRLAR